MGNKASLQRSSSRPDNSITSPRSTRGSISQYDSPRGSVSKFFSANTASIRPVEQTQRKPTPLDQKITNALKQRWQQRSQQKEMDNHFTRILLKFPQAADAFNSARTTFQAFDKNNKGYIEFSDLSKVFEQLGAKFSTEEISQVFQESDMVQDDKLNFNEFLRIPSLEGNEEQQLNIPMARTSSFCRHVGEGNKLRLAFQLAVDAFIWFDVNGDGVINRPEMSLKFQHSITLHSPTKNTSARDFNKDTSDESSNQAIWEQRFTEMDWNGDGTINFKEFLMAFVSWVGLEEM